MTLPSISSSATHLADPPSLAEPAVASHDPFMAKLAAAAEAADTRAFLTVYPAIDWPNRPPEDFIHATRWALAAGAHLAAREIATLGAEQHPDHAELQKYAHVLAPPKVIPGDLPPDPSIRADRDWLMAHSHEYRGRWVALRRGEFLASAPTLDELTEQVPVKRGILFTKVF